MSKEKINTEWYKGRGEGFEQNFVQQRQRDKNEVDEGRAKYWDRLMTEKPSVLAKEWRDAGKSPETVANFLVYLWVEAYPLKTESGKQFVRVVDGFYEKENRLTVIYTEVYWE